MRKSKFEASLGKKLLSQKKRAGGMAPVVRHLPSKPQCHKKKKFFFYLLAKCRTAQLEPLVAHTCNPRRQRVLRRQRSGGLWFKASPGK
jgi:hypothetical protein